MPYPYTYARMSVPAGTRQILALIENPDFNTNADLYYKVDTSFGNYDIANTPVSYGFTALTANNLISVQNTNYVTFSVVGKNIAPVSSKVTVVSMPDFAQLGSFTVNVVTVAANDPTPTPTPSWQGAVYAFYDSLWSQTSALLTGFTTSPITLSVTIQNLSGTTPELWHKVAATDPNNSWDMNIDPSSNGYTKLNNLETFTVTPNQYVGFATTYPGLALGSATVTVRNVSDGNTVLNSFVIEVLDYYMP